MIYKSQPTVASTFASPHEPTLKPKACKRASAFPARVTTFQDGLGLLTGCLFLRVFVNRFAYLPTLKKTK